MRKSKIALFLKKYINGTKGVISLFLAILMVPFATIAGALINAARINSAVAIFDEALCNASNSTLGTYDSFIRSRFALMALSQNTSSGGTEYGATTANYTADNLINDIFCYYMEQNFGSLSNTYNSTTLNATGLYPLSDPAVMQSSVLQTSKITVPAKLAIDWGSLDDMLNQITKPLNVLSSFESSLASGMTVVTDIDKLSEKQETFEKKIDECNTARSEYETVYTDFKNAADQFNTLIDNINSATAQVNTYQRQVNNLEKQTNGITSQIEAKEQEIAALKEDKDNDHTDEIEQLKEEIEKLEEEREELAPGYNTAVTNLNSAKSTLETYKNQFSSRRTAVVNAKNTYYNKIVALRNAINGTCSAAVAFQNAVKSLINDSLGLVSDITSTCITVAKESNSNQIKKIKEENENLRYQMTLAENDGYDEYVTYYYNQIQENESTNLNLSNNSLNLSNTKELVSDTMTSLKNANCELTNFANIDLEGEYKTIYNELETLRLRVYQVTVPEAYSKITYNNCYYTVVNPVEVADISEIIENIEDQIVSNSGWAVLKGIVSFLKALLKISLDYDVELTSTINTGLYSSNGGLPSTINREDYPIISQYESEDAALSNYYKNLLNSYSSDEIYISGSNVESAFSQMMEYIDTLQQLMEPFKLKNIKAMGEAAINLFSTIVGCDFGTLLTDMGAAMGHKLLIVGYISYNTANRTTYSGKALTGASYNLPGASTNEGYVFSGAETEYIYHGSMSEKTNQQKVFSAIWWERLIFNAYAILSDTTIQTIATNIGALTYGIGTIITYVLCFAVEGFVDAVILANGGEIPIAKTCAYITPAGIPKLLQKVCSLSLSDSVKQSIYEGACGCAYDINGSTVLSDDNTLEFPRYSDYKAEQSKLDNKFSNMFTIDYTKSLQLILLLFKSTDTMIDRLADLIQMEASYNAKKGAATYGFNLDKSYTYLRVSGSFSSNVFIKVGDDDSLTSEQRIVYNGY